MQFGAFLPTYWTDYRSSDVRTAIQEAAKTAEALGYTSVWANDHVIAPAHQADVGHIIEPLITLASLVHLVPRLQLGTSVVVLPQRQAILVAKQAAALDVLSGGRFILGVGVGWLKEEFQFLNADFARRSAVTDEAIRAMRVLWREERASVQGQFVSFSDAVFFPKPTSGGPPLWVGGNSHRAIRRAARFGDAWVPFGIGLDDFAAGVGTLRRMATQGAIPTIAAHMRIRISMDAKPRSAHLAGPAEMIASAVERYRQAGLEYLICDFVAESVEDLVRQMRVMAEEIVPQLTT
jgi:probable F420-dependent oxidoreductase